MHICFQCLLQCVYKKVKAVEYYYNIYIKCIIHHRRCSVGRPTINGSTDTYRSARRDVYKWRTYYMWFSFFVIVFQVDETGFPVVDGLMRLYNEGVQDRNYYMATLSAVRHCISIAQQLKQLQPTKKFGNIRFRKRPRSQQPYVYIRLLCTTYVGVRRVWIQNNRLNTARRTWPLNY